MISTRSTVEDHDLSVTVGDDRAGLNLVLVIVEEDGVEITRFHLSPELAVEVAKLLERYGNEALRRDSRSAEVQEVE